MSDGLLQLGPLDVVAGRPFTNAEGSAFDLTVLQYMVETVYRMMMEPQAILNQPPPVILYLNEVGRRLHRIAFSKPETLLKSDDLTVVGFCGQKRPGVDRGPIEAMDRELIAEFSQQDYLLSYSTLQLECGNACNLVLFSHPQGVSHWTLSEKHAVSVSMAPEYYSVIRLHNAILAGGVMSHNKLALIRTKYYDFQEEPLWQAVRDF